MNLSVAIATYNEEENIEKCLESVYGWVDEIVLIDGGSTDKTIEIAKRYKTKTLTTDNPAIFHINKQKSLDACRGTWILQLDADEIVSRELKKEILSITDSKKINAEVVGYYLPRKNYFLGNWMKKGGLYPDYVIRLFKNHLGKFPSKSVHEQIQINGSLGYLEHPLIHNTAPTLASYWVKASRYISLKTKELVGANEPIDIGSFVKHVIIAPLVIFINLALRHKGILDGWRGLLFALMSALHAPLAYIRYWRVRSQKL